MRGAWVAPGGFAPQDPPPGLDACVQRGLLDLKCLTPKWRGVEVPPSISALKVPAGSGGALSPRLGPGGSAPGATRA
jgi:hypothetical protein